MNVGGIGPGGGGGDWNRKDDWDDEDGKDESNKEINQNIQPEHTDPPIDKVKVDKDPTSDQPKSPEVDVGPKEEKLAWAINAIAFRSNGSNAEKIPPPHDPSSASTTFSKLTDVNLSSLQQEIAEKLNEKRNQQMIDHAWKNINIHENNLVRQDRNLVRQDRNLVRQDRNLVKQDFQKVKIKSAELAVQQPSFVEEKQKREANIKKYVLMERLPNGQIRLANADPNHAGHLEKIQKGEVAEKRKDGKFVFMSGLSKEIESAPEKVSIVYPDGSVVEHLKSEIFVAATKEEEDAAKEAVRAYREILHFESQLQVKQETSNQLQKHDEDRDPSLLSPTTPGKTHSDHVSQKWRDQQSSALKPQLVLLNVMGILKDMRKKERDAQRHSHEIKQIQAAGKRTRDLENDIEHQNIRKKARTREDIQNEGDNLVRRSSVVLLPPFKPEEGLRSQQLAAEVRTAVQNELSISGQSIWKNMEQRISQLNVEDSELYSQLKEALSSIQNLDLSKEQEAELHEQLNALVAIIEIYPKVQNGENSVKYEEFKVLINRLRIIIGKI